MEAKRGTNVSSSNEIGPFGFLEHLDAQSGLKFVVYVDPTAATKIIRTETPAQGNIFFRKC